MSSWGDSGLIHMTPLRSQAVLMLKELIIISVSHNMEFDLAVKYQNMSRSTWGHRLYKLQLTQNGLKGLVIT